MNSSYTPAESAATLSRERSMMVGPQIMCVAYGAATILFFQCIDALLTRQRHSGIRSWTLLGFLCTTFVLATGAVGFQLKWTTMTFVDYRLYPGGPIAFEARFFQYSWLSIAGDSCLTLVNWLTDALLLYRYYVIWQANYLMLVFPVLMYAGAIICSICFLVSVGPFGGGIWSSKAVNLGTAYWSLSVALNIIITLLICYRLLASRKKIRQAMQGHDDGMYTSISAMLIESATLYSVWGLMFLIANARGNKVLHNILISAYSEIQAISTFLIVLRVAQGRAWSQDTASAATGTLNTLRFGHPSVPPPLTWDSQSQSQHEVEPKAKGMIPNMRFTPDVVEMANTHEVRVRSLTPDSDGGEGVDHRWSASQVV